MCVIFHSIYVLVARWRAAGHDNFSAMFWYYCWKYPLVVKCDVGITTSSEPVGADGFASAMSTDEAHVSGLLSGLLPPRLGAFFYGDVRRGWFVARWISPAVGRPPGVRRSLFCAALRSSFGAVFSRGVSYACEQQSFASRQVASSFIH